MIRLLSLPFFLLLLALTGCGASLGAVESDGFTSCGAGECQPGQHCSDATFDECSYGCLSDANCPAGDSCVITSGNTGTCGEVEEDEGDDDDDAPSNPAVVAGCISECDWMVTQCTWSDSTVRKCVRGCEEAETEDDVVTLALCLSNSMECSTAQACF